MSTISGGAHQPSIPGDAGGLTKTAQTTGAQQVNPLAPSGDSATVIALSAAIESFLVCTECFTALTGAKKSQLSDNTKKAGEQEKERTVENKDAQTDLKTNKEVDNKENKEITSSNDLLDTLVNLSNDEESTSTTSSKTSQQLGYIGSSAQGAAFKFFVETLDSSIEASQCNLLTKQSAIEIAYHSTEVAMEHTKEAANKEAESMEKQAKASITSGAISVGGAAASGGMAAYQYSKTGNTPHQQAKTANAEVNSLENTQKALKTPPTTSSATRADLAANRKPLTPQDQADIDSYDTKVNAGIDKNISKNEANLNKAKSDPNTSPEDLEKAEIKDQTLKDFKKYCDAKDQDLVSKGHTLPRDPLGARTKEIQTQLDKEWTTPLTGSDTDSALGVGFGDRSGRSRTIATLENQYKGQDYELSTGNKIQKPNFEKMYEQKSLGQPIGDAKYNAKLTATQTKIQQAQIDELKTNGYIKGDVDGTGTKKAMESMSDDEIGALRKTVETKHGEATKSLNEAKGQLQSRFHSSTQVMNIANTVFGGIGQIMSGIFNEMAAEDKRDAGIAQATAELMRNISQQAFGIASGIKSDDEALRGLASSAAAAQKAISDSTRA